MSKENQKNQKKETNMDLKVMALLILMTILFLIPPLTETFVRTILGLLMVIFIPGYAFIAAIFPKNDDLEDLERLTLSIGLSIALSILVGFLLTYTPWGIRLDPNIIVLGGFSIIMVFVAFKRRNNLPLEKRYELTFIESFKKFITYYRGDTRKERRLSLALVIVIILAITSTTYLFMESNEDKFTEFYLLNSNGQASDYPTSLTMGGNSSVILGVINHEDAPVNYLIRVKTNNITLQEFNFTLENNETKEIPFNFTASVMGQNKMEFLLYKLPDNTNVYRSLHIWFQVS